MNRVLEVLGKLEQMTDFDSCLPLLKSSRLSDEELRAIVDAKFNGDLAQLQKAYQQYGPRLVSPEFKSVVFALMADDSPREVDSYAHVI